MCPVAPCRYQQAAASVEPAMECRAVLEALPAGPGELEPAEGGGGRAARVLGAEAARHRRVADTVRAEVLGVAMHQGDV
jgi:hypothetical protein